MDSNNIFDNLFVLEAANNHWGSVDRGLKIVSQFAQVVRFNGVKAAIKLQFRDVDNFIHSDHKGREDSRYIKKTEDTKLAWSDFKLLSEAIRKSGCIPMATPFDELSVDRCVEFDFPIIKVASSDLNDWPLLEKIAATRLPTIVSSGGGTEKDLDEIVIYFERRNIPLAINHCVSLYPSEDSDLCLDQIDYFKKRYPGHVIGFSTHEYHDWHSSMHISYAKGARTWERHIDIDDQGIPVSAYCSLPHQVDEWFKAFLKAQEMCGGVANQRRVISKEEHDYLAALVRGVYARTDLPEGYRITSETFNRDFYLAIPLQKGQLSCREVLNGEVLTKDIKINEKLMIDDIDGPYSDDPDLRKYIQSRGQ